jgi:hypothetical protein
MPHQIDTSELALAKGSADLELAQVQAMRGRSPLLVWRLWLLMDLGFPLQAAVYGCSM